MLDRDQQTVVNAVDAVLERDTTKRVWIEIEDDWIPQLGLKSKITGYRSSVFSSGRWFLAEEVFEEVGGWRE